MKTQIIVALLLTSCGYFKNTPSSDAGANPNIPELRLKHAEWVSSVNAGGILSLPDCDLALWAGEARAGGADVDLAGFEMAPGALRRNPGYPCTPASRDMVLGYAYGKWSIGDLPALQRLADYGESHQWNMSSDASLSSIDIVSRGVLGRAIASLSHDADKRSYAANPMACIPLAKDYERHLQVLEALLEGEIVGGLPGGCVGVLKAFAEDGPHDALFQAAYGIYSGDEGTAIDLLLDPAYVVPSYVRGAPNYDLVHRMFAANTVLKRY